MGWTVPYFDLRLEAEDKQAVLDVLDRAWLSMGPKIEAFEAAFATALTTPAAPSVEAVAVTNCTVALHLALAACGVGPGDEVITPSLTFVADANAAVQCGAKPVFADVVSRDDWTVDPASVARLLTPRTKAVIAVHYAGYPCRLEALRTICADAGVALIEDAAHAPLASHDGRSLGTFGEVGVFSFFSNKNMTTGEGGMVVTRDEALAQRLRTMRSHGMTTSSYQRFRGHAFAYDVLEPGFNYRMDELRAALGLAQLTRLPASNAARRDRVLRYRERLASVEGIHVPFADRDGDYGFHAVPVLLPEGGPDRHTVMDRMKAAGIQTSIHYRPIHTFQAYEGAGPLPVTDAIAPRILSLPLYPHLTDADQDRVVAALAEAVWARAA